MNPSPLPKVLGWINSSRAIFDLKLEHILEKDLEESKLWLSREHEESTYKRDLTARWIIVMGP